MKAAKLVFAFLLSLIGLGFSQGAYALCDKFPTAGTTSYSSSWTECFGAVRFSFELEPGGSATFQKLSSSTADTIFRIGDGFVSTAIIPPGEESIFSITNMTAFAQQQFALIKFDWNESPDDRLDYRVTITPVPEPSTYALMLAGLIGIGFVAHRRREAVVRA